MLLSVEVFPEAVTKVWKEWEVRGLVLVSLALHVSLVLVGGRRKYITSHLIRLFTWCAYLMADWVPSVALGVLSSSHGGEELMAFWASFLLLHLGGPDAITAFSFSDNELWIRHMAGVSIQTCLTTYIVLMSWRANSWLSVLTVVMLLPGIIKYIERSWALKSANRDEFHESGVNMLRRYRLADLRSLLLVQNVANRFMKAGALPSIDSNISLTRDESNPVTLPESGDTTDTVIDIPESARTLTSTFLDAHEFFEIFKVLFVDLILGLGHRHKSVEYMKTKDSESMFDIIEIELGFAYDTFYTKAPINYTRWGSFSRFLTSSLTCIVFVIFSITIYPTSHGYQTVDVAITFVLFVGAVFVEIYSILVSFSSDWINLWLIKSTDRTRISKVITRLQFHKKYKSRWSRSMGQYNLLRFSLNPMQKPFGVLRLFLWPSGSLQKWQMEKMESVRQLNIRAQVSDHLKTLIFNHFRKKSEDNVNTAVLCTLKGDGVFKDFDLLEKLSWTTEVEFDHSILIWHVATDICYCSDADYNSSYKDMSKHLADYMLYLLVKCPFMLPIGMGMLRFQDTCAASIKLFKADRLELKDGEVDSPDFRIKLLLSSTSIESTDKSALKEASALAKILEATEMSKEDKWAMVSNVWVEMLGYAANQCRGPTHAEKLAEGGELLTHIWFLMAHFGISQRYQD